MKLVKRSMLSMATILLIASSVFAQGFQIGTISGVVTDETGGVLPGVTVEVVSPDRGLTRNSVTGAEGRYRFPSLPLGRYNVTANLQGFQPATVRSILVEQDKTTDVPLTLRLSAESVEITVTGEAPVVDRTNVSVNTRVSTEEFEKAPVGRGYQALLALAPGVIDQPGNPSGGNPQVHGSTNDSNLYLFDGVDTTDTTTGTFGANSNFEAIQEVAIYTSGVSAEYGRATGAIMNVITKSGTNEFEGSLKAIATNDKWNEQNKTSHPINGTSFARTKNDVDNIRYSATLGGPFWRDRVWFFGAYETFESSGAPLQTTVTNEEYIANTEITLENYRLTAQLTPSINVWGKYASDPFTGIIRDYWGASPELFSLTSQNQGGDNMAVQATALFGGSWLAEAMWAESGGTIDVVPYRISPLHGGAPHYSYADGKYYNGATFDGYVDRPREQMLGAVSYFATLFGQSHNFKGGFDWQEQKSSNLFAFPTGVLYGDESFDPFTRTFVPFERYDYEVGPSTSTGEILAVYLRDKFDIGSRMYADVGFRYEDQSGKNDTGLTVLDTTVIAPRLGLSYDVMGDSRTLANLTLGRFYQSVIQNFHDSFASVPQQTNYDYYLWNGTEYEYDSTFAAGADSLQPNLGLDPQYVDEITLGFQQQVGSTMGFGVRGIFREYGDLLDDVRFFNPDGTATVEFVNHPDASREYMGLELTFEKRFSNHWNALANYTYAETTGNHITGGGGTFVTAVGDYVDETCEVTGDATIGVVPCRTLTTTLLDGNPTWDVPHLVNVLAAYSRPVGPVNLTVGTSGIWSSGNAYSKTRTARVYTPGTTDPSGQTITYYYEGPGSERLPDWWALNLATEVTFDLLNSVELGLKGEIFNLTDNQDQVVVSAQTWCEDASNTACQTARNLHGLGTARGAYQGPRNYRLTALIRF